MKLKSKMGRQSGGLRWWQHRNLKSSTYNTFGLGIALALPLVLASSALAGETFDQAISLPVTGGPASVHISASAAGAPGLVVGNGTGRVRPSVSMLDNQQNGFVFSDSQVQISPQTALLQAVTSADLDGNGTADFATAGDDLGSTPTRALVTIYLRGGTAALALGQQHTLNGFFVHALEAADITGDGKVDLIVAHNGVDDSTGAISILAGDGSGGFAAPETLSVGAQPVDLVIADLDADGRSDLAVADPLDGQIYALFGTPDAPTLEAPVALTALDGVRALAFATPGARVLLAASGAEATATSIAIAADRSTSVVSTLGLVAGQALDILAGDLDDDGDLDAALLSKGPGQVFLASLSSSGALALTETLTLGAEPDSFAAADFNNDGFPDLSVSSASADRVFIFPGGSNELPPPALCGPSPLLDCQRGTKSKLRIRSTGGSSNNLRWGWQTDEVARPSGDPASENITYAFCMYSSGTSTRREVGAHTRNDHCVGGDCWTALGSSGLRYGDGGSFPDGVSKLTVAHPRKGGTKIVLKGRGANLSLPELPLPEGSDSIAQLVNDRGACWETVFDADSVRGRTAFYAAKYRSDR